MKKSAAPDVTRDSRAVATGSTGPEADAADIAGAALLQWGEHCIECAAPACYTSCDLYDPTDQGKCRRFESGIVPRVLSDSPRPAAEIRFRRWGKLEAQGNRLIMAPARHRRADKWAATAVRTAAAIGALIRKLTGSRRFLTAGEGLGKRLNRWLDSRADPEQFPDAVQVDIDNREPAAHDYVLKIYVDVVRMALTVRTDQLPPPAMLAIRLEPGRNQLVMADRAMGAIIGSGLPFNLALTPANDDGGHIIVHRLDLIRRAATPAAVQSGAVVPGKAAKLVVFDLDHTLWSGVLLEGAVRLHPAVSSLIRTLDERGVLLSIASKNAHDDAMEKLRSLGLESYFLYPQIGWGPKSQGIRALVDAIDIGMDTVLFIDDNPFERAEVAAALPSIECLDETAIITLAAHPRLQGTVTPESRNRRAMYQQDMVRKETAAQFGDDYIEFLKASALRVEIRRERSEDIERIAELVQRTNQLNFSGRKYDRDAILSILADAAQSRSLIIAEDRYGQYGTVGFCLWRLEQHDDAGPTLHIDDLMLSCRVQGKFIEQALLYAIARDAEVSGRPVTGVVIRFRQTERNRAAQLVLEKLLFAVADDGFYRRAISGSADLAVDFMVIDTGASALR